MMKLTLDSIGRFGMAALVCAAFALPAQALEVGEAAPALELQGQAGPVTVVTPGKVTYVDFWASWCVTCRQSFPFMNGMQAKYAAQGLQVVGVNLDAEAKDAATFLAKVPAEFTIAYDASGKSAKQYGVKGMPTSLIIGRDGKVLYKHMGFSERDSDELEAQIRAAVGAAQ